MITRRNFVQFMAIAGVALIAAACARNTATEAPTTKTAANGADRLEKSREQWRDILEPRQYAVLFEDDTERPFSSPLNSETRSGTFVCAACGLPLFESKTKFKSTTGWPSFYAPIQGNVATKVDHKLLYPRTEYHCRRCGGHQGHVFDDGPAPTGQRWCNNGVALKFVPAEEPLPELRR